jgi:acetyltransferase-like isoleucine patch superfamily enzyme
MRKLLRRASNRFLHLLARSSPGATTLRPFLHRLRGVRILDRVFISDDVYIENEHPECVEIHEDVQIGIRTIILAHTRGAGKVLIEKFAYIGPSCVILGPPGRTLTVGEGSVVAAGSVVSMSVPAYTLARGNPAVPVAKVTVPLSLATNYEDFITGLAPFKKTVARVVNDTD